MHLGFVFEQHFRHTLGRHLLTWSSLVCALDERQLEASAGRRWRAGLLSQASPQQAGDRVLELPVLLDRVDLHLAHQVVGQIEGCLHGAILPASWFSGLPALGQSAAEVGHERGSLAAARGEPAFFCAMTEHLFLEAEERVIQRYCFP